MPKVSEDKNQLNTELFSNLLKLTLNEIMEAIHTFVFYR